MTFETIQRDKLIVYLNTLKNSRAIQQYGDQIYFNKRNKYAIIYVNQKDTDTVIPQLEQLSQVKEVVISPDDYTASEIKAPLITEEEEQAAKAFSIKHDEVDTTLDEIVRAIQLDN